MGIYNFDTTYSYHSIKIEHPLLNYYGITAVTTGQLLDWWYQKNYRGDLINRNFLKENGSLINSISELLNVAAPQTDDNDSYTFAAWRQMGYNGKNVKYWAPDLAAGEASYDPWSYYEFDNTIYGYDNLQWDGTSCGGGTVCIIGPQDSVQYDPYVSGNVAHYPLWFAQIIKNHECLMENYVSLGANPANWPLECLKARKILSDDIIMNGGISWTGVIGYQIKIDNIICNKFDTAKFTLQLHDAINVRQNYQNDVAFKDLLIARAATDVAGRKIRAGTLINGAYEEPLEGVIKDYTPGQVSLTWNPVENKYESGTIQIPAVFGSDIPAANGTTYDYLDGVDVAEMLDDPESNKYLNMPTGVAIPLLNLNGNPTTIGPHYNSPKNCEDTGKLKLIVHNPWSRSWSKDDRVMLQKINGVWIPLDPGQAPEDQTNEVLGQWDFAYFMTNAEHYFTNWYPNCVSSNCPSDTDNTNIFLEHSRFTYTQYESMFRYNVYATETNDIKNKNLSATTAFQNILPFPRGYWHITSFDFMGSGMCGTRVGGLDGNALAITVPGYDVYDTPVDPASNVLDPYYNPELTNPFFGCVFPDGYNAALVKAKYDSYKANPKYIVSYPTGDAYYRTDATGIKTSDIFVDKNRNVEAGPEGSAGMFGAINRGTSYLLRHLPADIALNSTPDVDEDQQKGSPATLYDDRFTKFMTAGYHIDTYAPKKAEDYKLNTVDTEQYFQENYNSRYLYHYNGGDGSPIWNLSPNNIGRIQFRPMKAELYCSLDWRAVYLTDYMERKSAENKRYELGCTDPNRCNPSPSNKDERLKTLLPAGKFVGGGWRGGLSDSRGKFGVRAALMVDDFWKDTLTISGVAYVDTSENSLFGVYKPLISSIGGNPLWGSRNVVEARNINPTGELYSSYYSKIPNLSNFDPTKNYQPNDTFQTLVGANNWRLYNGLEVFRQLMSLDENKYAVEKFALNAFPNDDPLTENPTYPYPLYAKPYYLGLALGYYDYYHRIKTTELTFTQNTTNYSIARIGDGYGANLCGLGAVGVIGAICRVKSKAPEGITFSAQCRYGLPTDTVNGEPRATFQDIDGINGLYAFNATALYARIFHSWPRELTVYDPRYFAVHHFNEGIGERDYPVVPKYYINGRLIENPTGQEIGLAEQNIYNNGKGNFIVEAVSDEYSVDITVPTTDEGLQVNFDQAAPTGSTKEIWGDGWNRVSQNFEKIRAQKHWSLFEGEGFSDGRNRRGRLLPYSYEKKTIGIAHRADVINLIAVDANKMAKEINMTQTNGAILVINAGKGYVVGDKLTTSGGLGEDVVLTVQTVDANGAILALLVTQTGEGFEPTDFMNSTTYLNQSAKSKVKIVNFEAKGTGFVGYAMVGMGTIVQGYDEKPTEVTTPVKLTNPTDGLKGIVNETVEKTVAIPSSLRKDDGIYDVFFHYHNDASHVMGYNWNSLFMHDQYITLEIK